MKEQQIINEAPFKELFRIISVQSLAHEHARSGNTYRLETTAGSYKITHFDEPGRAREYATLAPLLYPAIPQVLGVQGQYLLSEWLQGTTLSIPISSDEARAMGAVLGRIASVNLISAKDPMLLFNEALESCKPYLSSKVFSEVMHWHATYRPLQVTARLEAADAQSRNFMRVKGRTYFVDEGGVAYKMKGLSLAKPYLHGYLDSLEKKWAFEQGYQQFEDLTWFTESYKRFVMLYQAVRSVHYNKNNEKKLVKKLHLLEQLLPVLREPAGDSRTYRRR